MPKMTSDAQIDERPKPRLLDGLDAEALAAIRRAGKEQRFGAGSVIVNQNQSARKLFLLLDGRARHFFITGDGHKILLRWLVPGEITGAAALLSKPSWYQLSTEALTDTQLLIWDWDTLQELTTLYPAFLRNSLFIIEDYLDYYLTAHILLNCRTAPERCAYLVRRLAPKIGRKVAGGIEIDLTNEECANAAGITLFEATRIMADWHRSGVIVKTGGQILVRSFDSLMKDPETPQAG